METKIPKQLQDRRCRFVLLVSGKKYPKELGWQINDNFYDINSDGVWFELMSGKKVEVPEKTAVKHPADNFLIETDEPRKEGEEGKKHYYYKGEIHSYSYDDPKVIDWIKNGGCLGLLTGVGGIVCIDLDKAKFKKRLLNTLPKTFTGLSGGKKLPHLYYFVDDLFDKYPIKDENNETVMDVLGLGAQVVIPLSQVTEDCKYEILNDIPITKLPTQELKALLWPFEIKKTPLIEKKVSGSSSQFVSDLVSQVTVPEVLSDLGVDTSSNPTQCPFHSSVKGKCLGFTDDVCHCFNCDQSYNVISLIKEAKKIESNEAIDYLSELAGLQKERKADKEQWFKDNVQDKPTQNYEEQTTQEKINEAEPLNVWSVSDYKKHKPSKDFLIKGIKYPNESEMFSGHSGAGKSIHEMYQAVCISTGRKYLDKFKTKKSKVLFVPAETSNDWVKRVLEGIMKGMKVRVNRNLFFLPRSECDDLLDPRFQARICKTIEENDIKVIYFDTINPLTPSLDDNSAKDVTRLFNEFLKPIIDKYKVNITFLHHTDKKGQDYLGSMKWFANVDQASRINRDGLDNKVCIFNEKNRRGEVSILDLEMNFDNGKNTITYKLLGERSPSKFSKKKKMTQQEFFILKLNNLVKDKSTERKDIMAIFKENDIKFSTPTLDRAIKEWRVSE